MKSPAAYYLVLLYITVLLKPLSPLVQDVWAHAFNEEEHLTHVHGKYGSHHLEKELANTSSENDRNNTSNLLKSEDQVSFHVLPVVCQSRLSICKTDIQHHLTEPGKLPFVLLSLQGPPPKFS